MSVTYALIYIGTATSENLIRITCGEIDTFNHLRIEQAGLFLKALASNL
jgi:hypothetical protein